MPVRKKCLECFYFIVKIWWATNWTTWYRRGSWMLCFMLLIISVSCPGARGLVVRWHVRHWAPGSHPVLREAEQSGQHLLRPQAPGGRQLTAFDFFPPISAPKTTSRKQKRKENTPARLHRRLQSPLAHQSTDFSFMADKSLHLPSIKPRPCLGSVSVTLMALPLPPSGQTENCLKKIPFQSPPPMIQLMWVNKRKDEWMFKDISAVSLNL